MEGAQTKKVTPRQGSGRGVELREGEKECDARAHHHDENECRGDNSTKHCPPPYVLIVRYQICILVSRCWE
jgi:hypothetical protein